MKTDETYSLSPAFSVDAVVSTRTTRRNSSVGSHHVGGKGYGSRVRQTNRTLSIIPKVAALTPKEHGDARKAIDTLYETGRLAEKQGQERVAVK